MRALFLLAAFFIVSLSAFAQISFVEGYIVLTSGDTIQGFLNEKDLGNYRSELKFKQTQVSEIKIYAPIQLKGFYLLPSHQYFETATVDIDHKPIEFNKLERDDRLPKFVQETVFLKVVVKGKASLYSWHDDKEHFFIQKDGGEIKELIFIRFFNSVSIDGTATNMAVTIEAFKEQLKSQLTECTTLNPLNVSYTESSLIKWIHKYNECVGSTREYITEESKGRLVPYLFLGVAKNTYDYNGADDYSSYCCAEAENIQFSSNVGSMAGIGFEFVSAKKSNPFTFGLETFWKKTKSSGQISYYDKLKTVDLEFSFIRLNYSLKYSFNFKLKPFIRIGFSNGFSIKEYNKMVFTSGLSHTIAYDGRLTDFQNVDFGCIGGIGIAKDRIGLEFRVEHFKQVATAKRGEFITDAFGLYLSYRLLNN